MEKIEQDGLFTASGLVLRDKLNEIVDWINEQEIVFKKFPIEDSLDKLKDICKREPESKGLEMLNTTSLNELTEISKQIQAFADRFCNGG